MFELKLYEVPLIFLKGSCNMKTIEKITLVLFSTLMLIISVIFCLAIFGWVDVSAITNVLNLAFTNNITSNIILVLSIIFILLAIRCIFFDSSSKEKEEYKNGILLENSNGKLLITR